MNQVHIILYDKKNATFRSCLAGLEDGTDFKSHKDFARELDLPEPEGLEHSFKALVDPVTGDANIQCPFILTAGEETALAALFLGSSTIDYSSTLVPLDWHTTTTSTTTTTGTTTTSTTATTTSTTTT